MAYVPRFTQPDVNNPFWTSTRAGGYNGQIVPGDYGSLSAWNNSVLANCTGYVHGRWMELGNVNSDVYGISNGNATTYFSYNDGYERGQIPRLGAIACYSGGLYGGAGHVAIVEQINHDGSVVYSQSDYGISIFSTPTVQPPEYNPWVNQGLVFQGFIYHPGIEPVDPTYNLTVVNGRANKTRGKNGEKAEIIYTKKKGYKFVHWVLDGAGSISDVKNPSTNFTFGKGDSTVTGIEREQKKSDMIFYISPAIYKKH